MLCCGLCRFIAEKVIHHPTVIAAYCEGRKWVFEGDADVKSKFWGRSIELHPEGGFTLSLLHASPMASCWYGSCYSRVPSATWCEEPKEYVVNFYKAGLPRANGSSRATASLPPQLVAMFDTRLRGCLLLQACCA